MYARGMTTREIQGHIEEIYQTDISPDLITTITDEVLHEVDTWQTRPLIGYIRSCMQNHMEQSGQEKLIVRTMMVNHLLLMPYAIICVLLNITAFVEVCKACGTIYSAICLCQYCTILSIVATYSLSGIPQRVGHCHNS